MVALDGGGRDSGPPQLGKIHVGKKGSGDFSTPEQKIPEAGMPGKDWETFMTLNGTWGYRSYDDKWKSSETLIRNLVDIKDESGEFLLRLADGRIIDTKGWNDWEWTHGIGLYLGLELIRDHDHLTPATEETAAICERMPGLGPREGSSSSS